MSLDDADDTQTLYVNEKLVTKPKPNPEIACVFFVIWEREVCLVEPIQRPIGISLNNGSWVTSAPNSEHRLTNSKTIASNATSSADDAENSNGAGSISIKVLIVADRLARAAGSRVRHAVAALFRSD